MADRQIGRVRVYVGIMVVYITVLLYLAGIVLVGAPTGRRSPDDLVTGLIFLAVGMGVAFERTGAALSPPVY